MKRNSIILFMVMLYGFNVHSQDTNNLRNLKIIFIRHCEKPVKGDNLNCQGLNRSLLLPSILSSKFGVPDFVYVPSLGLGNSTKHSRMFQSVIPLAAKYNLTINSAFAEKDSIGISNDIKSKTGTILIVWEHHALESIVRALGIQDKSLAWDDSDFDSIWIIRFINGVAVLTKDKEGVSPSADCNF